MNQRTRAKLRKLARQVAKLNESMEALQQEVSDLAMEERDKADNMMDSNLAESEMAQRLEDSATEMEDLDGEVDMARDALTELEDRLQEVADF